MEIAQNILNLKKEIEGLDGHLIAVSKKFDISKIKEAYDAGQRDFAENYAAEAIPKIESLKDLDINWHFIGKVQTGSLNKIVNSFHMIHSVCKIEHLRKINNKTEKIQKVLLQIRNPSDHRGEGFDERSLALLFEESRLEFNKIDFSGLMYMPPPDLEGEQLELSFDWAKKIFDKFKTNVSKDSWDILSMGMSGDYRTALQMGSTHVRLGSAIFGARE